MTRYRIAAINDECEQCSRCGKSGLKRVAWVYEAEEGPASALPVGLDCAAILLGYGERKAGKVAKEAVRRVVIESIIQDFTEWLAVPIQATITTQPGKFLRIGQDDFKVEAGGITAYSPVENGSEAAMNQAAWDLTRAKVGELAPRWYAATSLKTSFIHEEQWQSTCRNRIPRLDIVPATAR